MVARTVVVAGICRGGYVAVPRWERLYALYKSVQYVVENRIPGDIVECGVWRGGSMKLAAHVLLALGVTDRTLFLYDTFEGMTEPDPEVDLDSYGNNAANDWLEVQRRGTGGRYDSGNSS